MRNRIFTITLTLVMLFWGFNINLSFAKKDINFFDEIVKAVKGSIEEYGIKAVVFTEEDGETFSNKILKSLNMEKAETDIIRNDKIYCIEFKSNNVYGYIESMKYDNYNGVTVNVVNTDDINNADGLKELIEKAIGKNQKEVKYYQYLKAKVLSSDMYKTNEDIEALLKYYGAHNIETVEIENGYSTVAYTGKYPAIRSGGKLIDLNYAVCSYTSGNYVIVGTPIITASY